MPFVDKLREAVIGKPHNPLHPDTRHNIALVAFLRLRIGLGAGGHRLPVTARRKPL